MKRPGMKFAFAGSLLLGLAITIFILFISMQSIEELVATNSKVFKGYESSRALNRLVSDLLKCESATRGFSIWGDTAYLNHFEEDAKSAYREMENLSASFVHSPLELKALNLGELVTKKIAHNKKVQELFINEGKTVADLYFGTNIGKSLMDSVHILCNYLEVSVEQNIKTSIARSDSFSQRVLKLDLMAALLAMLLVISAIILLFRDVDRRHKLEESLRESRRKAEASAQLKEQFMANMSHEIRTPLNAILGFANLIGKTNLDQKQAELLEAIRASGDNLLNIVNDILDFSRIEEGMLLIHKVPFSLEGLLQSVETMFKTKAKEKNIALIFKPIENRSFQQEVAPSSTPQSPQPNLILPTPYHLEGDPTRLTQILVNLIGNALKFTDRGSVEVATCITESDDSNVVLDLAIQDTGIGIPKEQIDKVFERFHQGKADTTRRFGGTGLGLTIVKRLVELQGGGISVVSTPGLGSTFKIKIPYYKSKISPVERTLGGKIEKRVIGDLKILIVEDNPMNQRLTTLLLENWGIRYELAENGLVAIAMLKKSKFDMVLMDIQMPEMDGYQAAEIIRGELHLEVPIIAMTAHAMSGERDKCIGFGMDEYIAKPIQESILYELILKLGGKQGMEKPSITRRVNLGYLIETSRGNTSFVREMCELFLLQVPLELDGMDKVHEAGGFGELASLAHGMKSTITSMGLGEEVLELLQQIEENAHNRRTSTGALLKDLRTVCTEIMAEVRGILAGL